MIAETETPVAKTPFRFTRENAKQFSAKANQARWSRAKEKQSPDYSSQDGSGNESDFAATRLVIIRERIDFLLDELKREKDAKAIMQLCASLDKLASIEQKYAGRPSPGTLKPVQAKGRRSAPSEFSPKPIENAPRSVLTPTSPGVSTDSPAQSPELPPL